MHFLRNLGISEFRPCGVVTTFAGQAGTSGTANGTGGAARFSNPNGITIDSANNLYVSDSSHRIRKIDTGGVVTTFAGQTNTSGSTDGTGTAARFWFPAGLAVDSAGNIFVGDGNNSTIRRITPAGVVTTFAGSPGLTGTTDGTSSAARFAYPSGIAIDPSDNVYVNDYTNYTVRKITPVGVVSTFAGLAGASGTADGTGSSARFDLSTDLCSDTLGNIYVSEIDNGTIRKITPGAVVTTIVGDSDKKGVKLGPLPTSLGRVSGIAHFKNKLFFYMDAGVFWVANP